MQRPNFLGFDKCENLVFLGFDKCENLTFKKSYFLDALYDCDTKKLSDILKDHHPNPAIDATNYCPPPMIPIFFGNATHSVRLEELLTRKQSRAFTLHAAPGLSPQA